MTLNKNILSATLLGACLSTTTIAQASEELTTPPSEVIGMIVDGTKTAATAVADASVKTYQFVKPYAGAAWDTTKEVTAVAATKTKDAAIKGKEFISERMNSNAEPHVPAPIENYSLSHPQVPVQNYRMSSAPAYDNSTTTNTISNTTSAAPVNNLNAMPVSTPPAIEITEGEIVRGSIDPNDTNESVAITPKQTLAPARVGQTFVVEDEFTP